MSGSWATLPLPSWADPVRGQIMDAVRNWAAGLEKQAVPFIQEAGVANSFRRQQLGAHDPGADSGVLFPQRRARHQGRHCSILAHGASKQHLAILDDVHAMLQSYMKALVILAAASFWHG